MHRFIFFLLIGVIIFSAFAPENLTDDAFTGYAVASVTPRSIETKGIGWADKENSVRYSENTIQPIGSISKTFIGVSLLIAQEQGLVDLDKDINEYLDFKVVNPHADESNIITLRHLATHTSGIRDHEKYYELAYTKGKEPSMSLENYLRQYLIKGEAMYSRKNFEKHEAGTYYSYSNIGAALAAHVLEKATGVPFNEYTRQNILEPLGMKHSGWSYQAIDQAKHATLYDEENNPLEPYTLVTYPDGGFRTSASDLALYLQELIKGYHHQSDLMSNAAWDELFKKNFTEEHPVENIDPKEPNTGIFMIYSRSGKIGHSGSDPGVSAMMWFDPETSEGDLFMANEDLNEGNVETFKAIWESLK
uniref:Serine hydrolase n=1 Tax=Roseihalotalea indica TaxID=2867963 RepID=A0AA49GSI4_9BACT|nr:serine hydrolase [Tunicatimonas sp. TK19036]